MSSTTSAPRPSSWRGSLWPSRNGGGPRRWKHWAKPLEEANRTERIEALARSVLDGEILPGEVSFIVSSTPQAETIKNAWDMLRDEWIGEVDELSAMQRVALLAVDGWWANRAVDSRSRNPDEPAIAELIVSLVAGNPPDEKLCKPSNMDQ